MSWDSRWQYAWARRLRLRRSPSNPRRGRRQQREQKMRDRAVQAKRLRARDALRRGARRSSSSAAKASIRSSDRSRPGAASPTAPAFAIATCSTTTARSISGPRPACSATGPPRRASRFRSWRTSGCWSKPGRRTATTRRRTSSASVPTRLREQPDQLSRSGRTCSAPAPACGPSDRALSAAALEYLQPEARPRRRTAACRRSRRSSTRRRRPGLGESVDFLRSMAFVEVDYRQPKNARKGGWYRVDFSGSTIAPPAAITFNRLDADLRQFVGFLAGRRVIATRALRLDLGHRRRAA